MGLVYYRRRLDSSFLNLSLFSSIRLEMSVQYMLKCGSASHRMVVLFGTTSCRPAEVWMCTNLVKNNCLRSVSNSAACSTPIEVRIFEVMDFISGRALILLSTYMDITTILLVSLGLLVYMH